MVRICRTLKPDGSANQGSGNRYPDSFCVIALKGKAHRPTCIGTLDVWQRQNHEESFRRTVFSDRRCGWRLRSINGIARTLMIRPDACINKLLLDNNKGRRCPKYQGGKKTRYLPKSRTGHVLISKTEIPDACRQNRLLTDARSIHPIISTIVYFQRSIRIPKKVVIVAHHVLQPSLDEAADWKMVGVSEAVWLGGEIVVEGKAIPSGPMRTVSVPKTRVVGVAPLPIRYVEPEMTTFPGSTENVNESAVTTEGVIVAKGGMV